MQALIGFLTIIMFFVLLYINLECERIIEEKKSSQRKLIVAKSVRLVLLPFTVIIEIMRFWSRIDGFILFFWLFGLITQAALIVGFLIILYFAVNSTYSYLELLAMGAFWFIVAIILREIVPPFFTILSDYKLLFKENKDN